MMIIDSQVHIWAPETAEKPYAKENASPPHRAMPLGHDELLREMDGAGVRAACSCRRPGKPTATTLRWKRRGYIPIAFASWADSR